MLRIGQLVRIKQMKRVYGIVTEKDDSYKEFKFVIKGCYVPSPKSKLYDKSPFSKKKGRIISKEYYLANRK